LLKSRLKKFGIEVLTAADATTGFRIARNDMPSMIVAAHNLPDGNAERLLWRLRSSPRTRPLPVFIMAETLAKYTEDNLKREVAGVAGAAGFFTKPLDAEAFYPAIERYCSLAVAPPNRLAA
jgi:CheY-like chemotaxis protein